MNTNCGSNPTAPGDTAEYETVRIKKTKAVCGTCEDYAKAQSSKPVAVLSCEGACLRGEVARQAANELCYTLRPAQTVRICLGSAFTKDTGQRNLVRQGERVIALEGCFIKCASRMMQGVLPELKAEVILVDRLYEMDSSLFGINELPEIEVRALAKAAAAKIAERI